MNFVLGFHCCLAMKALTCSESLRLPSVWSCFSVLTTLSIVVSLFPFFFSFHAYSNRSVSLDTCRCCVLHAESRVPALVAHASADGVR